MSPCNQKKNQKEKKKEKKSFEHTINAAAFCCSLCCACHVVLSLNSNVKWMSRGQFTKDSSYGWHDHSYWWDSVSDLKHFKAMLYSKETSTFHIHRSANPHAHIHCVHTCEIKAITASHLTENAISLDKTFRLQKYPERHIFPLWWPASHGANSNKMQLHALRWLSADISGGWAIVDMHVYGHVQVCACGCAATHLCVSIFIRCVERSAVMTVSVKIKEIDL